MLIGDAIQNWLIEKKIMYTNYVIKYKKINRREYKYR